MATTHTTCLDRWNRQMATLINFCKILNESDDIEDPIRRGMLLLEKKTAISNIPIPLCRLLLNGDDNFAVLKYHVKVSIDDFQKIHDCLYYTEYEGMEKECMTRSAEKILELYAKLGWEGL